MDKLLRSAHRRQASAPVFHNEGKLRRNRWKMELQRGVTGRDVDSRREALGWNVVELYSISQACKGLPGSQERAVCHRQRWLISGGSRKDSDWDRLRTRAPGSRGNGEQIEIGQSRFALHTSHSMSPTLNRRPALRQRRPAGRNRHPLRPIGSAPGGQS